MLHRSPQSWPVTSGDVNIYHARIFSDQQIAYIVEFAEQADLNRLKESLRVLFAALPILSSRLVIQRFRFRRFKVETTDEVVQLIEAKPDAAAAVHQFITQPSDPLTEIPLKVGLIRGEQTDTLCVKVDHVLSDAVGLKYLLYLLAEAYTTGKISSPVNPRRGLGQLLRRFFPHTLIHALATADSPRQVPTLIDGAFEPTPFFIERAVISGETFAAMRQKSARDGATVNDLLLTALYRAIFRNERVDEGIPYSVMVPVDIRRYLPEKRRICITNLASSVNPSIKKIPQETFAETLRRVKDCMDEFKRHYPALGSLLLISLGAVGRGRRMEKIFRMVASGKSGSALLSNFGVIDPAKSLFGQLSINDLYAVGPDEHAPGFLIAVTSYRNSLTLTVRGNDSRFQCFIRDILQSIVAEIEAELSKL